MMTIIQLKIIPEKFILRKPALKTADVTPEVRQLLNQGLLESKNLVEWLVVDHAELLSHVLKDSPFEQFVSPVQQALAKPRKLTSMLAIKIVGEELLKNVTAKKERKSLVSIFRNHPSDTVRSWACMLLGHDETLTFKQKLREIITLADDANSGVREMAWMGMRGCCQRDLTVMLELLSAYSTDKSPNVRRFTSELTRPCGVWCSHLTQLKTNPELAIHLLEPLKSDVAKYVQDSVGNWLNDASKSQPDWVRSVCANWLKVSKTKQTEYIVNKALRTLRKLK
jgi:3-methyladenine DNA glycosylase AlkC